VWYENDGSENFTKHVIDSAFDGPNEVVGIDLDGDTDIDVVSAAQSGDEIAWWESDLAGISEETGNDDAIEKNTLRLTCTPNPFVSSTTIHLSGMGHGPDGMELQIYNMSGRLVKSVKLATSAYQLGADLKAGVYFIKVNGSIQKKVVKVR
jgi:hypothetical protein